ncbi:MAG: nuclear transport factor 2 family protein [Burkholderiales bacterium]
MTPEDPQTIAARVGGFFERMTPAALDRLGEIYAHDAYFRDPFNEVRGIEAIRAIFEKMYEELADCRFCMLETIAVPQSAVLTWNMKFRFRRFRPDVVQTIHGASLLKFDSRALVAHHRDYWDAADELYAKLPLVGPLMRYLKRRMG